MELTAIPWRALAPFAAVGFVAQLVDGSLGMGFGVMTNTALVLLGIPPTAAAATVRTVESFASGASGISHALRRNVDWPLFARLVLPGLIGGLLGTWLLLHVREALVRPVTFAYLGALGVYLLWRSPRRPRSYRPPRMVAPLSLVGAMIDARGGGWGPFVTGSLLAQGGNPRTVIGSVNAAEFFVTVTVASAFIGTLGLQAFTVATVGLLIGSVAAAPIGAVAASWLNPRTLVTAAGAVLVTASLYGILALGVEAVPLFSRY